MVFPRDYEKYSALIQEDAKLFIRGRVSAEEDKDGKLICEQIVTFEEAAGLEDGQPLFQERFRGGYNGRRRSYGGYSVGSARNAGPGGVNEGNGFGGFAAGQEGIGGRSGQGVVQESGSMNKVPNGIWIQFPTQESYQAREQELLAALADSDGNDDVVIYVKAPKRIKVLPPNRRVRADEALAEKLRKAFGQENVKIR